MELDIHDLGTYRICVALSKNDIYIIKVVVDLLSGGSNRVAVKYSFPLRPQFLNAVEHNNIIIHAFFPDPYTADTHNSRSYFTM